MATTAAERQRAYRQRIRDGQGERINLTVSVTTKHQLERLAHHYGVTQRAMLERLLADAEGSVVDGLSGKAAREYFDRVTA